MNRASHRTAHPRGAGGLSPKDTLVADWINQRPTTARGCSSPLSMLSIGPARGGSELLRTALAEAQQAGSSLPGETALLE